MKRLIFTDPALQDLQEIHDYIAKDNADIALEFIGRLQARCNEVVHFSGVGRKRDEISAGYRTVTEGEYVIFYKMLNNHTLSIMRIVHAKRDINKILFC